MFSTGTESAAEWIQAEPADAEVELSSSFHVNETASGSRLGMLLSGRALA